MPLTVQLLPLGDAPFTPPRQMSAHAAGFDVQAALQRPRTLGVGQRALIPCGFAMAMPAEFECQVRPRSGLALKYGVTVLNAPGTIDADYRGEVKVLLINLGDEEFVVKPGQRIAQLVFRRVVDPTLSVVTAFAGEDQQTERGAGGFGSTDAS